MAIKNGSQSDGQVSIRNSIQPLQQVRCSIASPLNLTPTCGGISASPQRLLCRVSMVNIVSGWVSEWISVLANHSLWNEIFESYRIVVSHPSWGRVSISERVSLGAAAFSTHAPPSGTLICFWASSCSPITLSAPDESFYLLVSSMCPAIWYPMQLFTPGKPVSLSPALSAVWSSAQLLTLKSGIFSVKFLLRSFFLNDPISLLSFPLLLEEIA